MTKPIKESVEDFHAEFLSVVGRVRRLRKYMKGLDSDEIEKVIERMETLLKERKAEEADRVKAIENKKAKVAMILDLMEEEGLSEDDLHDPTLVEASVKKGAGKATKYLYVDENQEEHRWSGRGKAPTIFKQLMEKGVDLDEECLVRREQSE